MGFFDSDDDDVYAAADRVDETGNALIDGLVQGGKWAADGIPDMAFAFYDIPGFSYWDEQGRAAGRMALNAWAEVADIRFHETYPGQDWYDNDNEMSFMLFYDDYTPVIAVSGFPDPYLDELLLASEGINPSDYPTYPGDVLVNLALVGDPAPGGMTFVTLLHEIGHALGLKHPHDDGGNNRPTFSELGIDNLDTNHYTVMSYYEVGNAPTDTGHPVTPMLLDILAIQQIYGANMTTRTGNTIYQYDANSERQTIWDAGGIDRYDFGGAGTTAGVFNINAGQDSYVGVGANLGRITTAYYTAIENVGGTAGGDAFIGNEFDNKFLGRQGDDAFWGDKGNDVLVGNGGGDTAHYKLGAAAFSWRVQGDVTTVNGPEGLDRLVGVEAINFNGEIVNIAGAALTNAVFRFYNTDNGTHFYTASAQERNQVLELHDSFRFEGLAFTGGNAANPASTDVFRFYDTDGGHHFYTANAAERDALIATRPDMQYEGAAFSAFAAAREGATALFRFYNSANDSHFYTVDANERDALIAGQPSYNYEGTAFWVIG